MPNCPKCGTRNPRENTVCRACGAVLDVEPPKVEVPAPSVEAVEEAPEEAPMPSWMAETAEPEVLAEEGAIPTLEAPVAAEAEEIPINRAVLFGAAAAIVCGIIWFLVDYYSNWELWWIPPLVGWIVAEAVVFGAGRKRARILQWIAAGLTAAVILVTLFITYTLLEQGDPASFFQSFTGERLWYLFVFAMGLWLAYTTPAPRRRRAAPAPAAEQMTEEAATKEGAVEEAPAEEAGLRCIRCQAAIPEGEALLLPGRLRGGTAALCPTCVKEIEARFAAETEDVQVNRGALFGLAAAVVCGGIWFAVEYFSGWPLIGVLALFSGWIIAEVVRRGAGKKRGQTLQWIAVGLTALTILGGEYAVQAVRGNADLVTFFQAFGASLLANYFDILLIVIGLWQAYSIPAPRRLRGGRR